MLTIAGAALLVVAVAASYAAARAALARCGEPSHAVAAALAVAFLAVVPGQVARAVDDLRIGLGVAALVAAAIVLALRRLPPAPTTTTSTATHVKPPRVALLAMAALFALVAACALRGNFYDEPAHWPTILQIARGVVPPRIVVEPDSVFHYHWGFDALSACIVDAGLDVEHAEDVAQCIAFALLLATGFTFGARVTGGPVGASVVAVGAPLASSALAWPLVDLGALSLPSPYPDRWSDPLQAAQPPITFFFQHPQGLAMPMLFAVVAVFLGESAHPSHARARRITGAVFLGLISLVNVAYFEALGVGLFAACAFTAHKTRDLRAFAFDVAALLGALALAVALGGILASGPPFVFGHFFHDPWPLVAAHHVVAFGLPLLALPFVPRLGRVGVALTAMAAVCFVIPNVVVLRDIWDIVKLDNIAFFAAGAGFFGLVGRALEERKHVALAAIAGALTCASALAWLGVTAARPPVEIVLRDDVDAWRRAFSPFIAPYARVLTDDPSVGSETGFHTPGFLLTGSTFDPYTYLGIDRAKAEREHRAWSRAVATLDRGALDELGVDYVLATPSFASHLSPAARAIFEDESKLEPVATADHAVLLRVVRTP